jgi:ATP-binding cassette, subfamily B, bacterial CvaB/MchF/RaxB
MIVGTSLNFSGRRRTPVILQSEATECGLACVAMVAGFHGYRTDLATLRQRDSVSSRGATMAHLMQIAARLDLAPRPLKIEIEALSRLPLPVILHWDFNHFVVLAAVKGDRYVVHDPALGERTLTTSELSVVLSVVCLVVFECC